MSEDEKAWTVRVPVKLLKDLDRESEAMGISRKQLAVKLLQQGLVGWKLASKAEAAGLFEDLTRDFESIVQKAIEDAVKSAGDPAMWKLHKKK